MNDIAFKLNCVFLVPDNNQSEASYSRLSTQLIESTVLEKVQEKIVLQAIAGGFITDDTVAIDATHFEAREQDPIKEKKPNIPSKKCGTRLWNSLISALAEQEAKLPLIEKKIEAQLDVTLAELSTEFPSRPEQRT